LLSPLRVRLFRYLAAAFTVNQCGNWMGDVALAIVVFDRTRSALDTATLFLALQFVPALLAPLLTARLETLTARATLPGVYLAQGLIFATIAFGVRHIAIAGMIALAALAGLLGIAAGALTRSATTAVLREHGTLREGNSILNLGFSVGGMLGPALAGVLIASFGASAALLIDAASFAVAAMVLGAAGHITVPAQEQGGWGARTRAGLDAVRNQTGLRRVLIGQAVALIFFTAVVPIEVVFVKQTLHAGDFGYGALLGAWGLGMVAGSVAFAVARQVGLIVLIATSTALIAVGYGGLALAPTLLVACLFSALGGIGNGTQEASVLTEIQQLTPVESLVAVNALNGAIYQVMPAIGFAFGGAITAVSSPRVAYATSAAGLGMLLLLAAVLTNHRQTSPRPAPTT
jgi:hypothetical protein